MKEKGISWLFIPPLPLSFPDISRSGRPVRTGPPQDRDRPPVVRHRLEPYCRAVFRHTGRSLALALFVLSGMLAGLGAALLTRTAPFQALQHRAGLGTRHRHRRDPRRRGDCRRRRIDLRRGAGGVRARARHLRAVAQQHSRTGRQRLYRNPFDCGHSNPAGGGNRSEAGCEVAGRACGVHALPLRRKTRNRPEAACSAKAAARPAGTYGRQGNARAFARTSATNQTETADQQLAMKRRP